MNAAQPLFGYDELGKPLENNSDLMQSLCGIPNFFFLQAGGTCVDDNPVVIIIFCSKVVRVPFALLSPSKEGFPLLYVHLQGLNNWH